MARSWTSRLWPAFFIGGFLLVAGLLVFLLADLYRKGPRPFDNPILASASGNSASRAPRETATYPLNPALAAQQLLALPGDPALPPALDVERLLRTLGGTVTAVDASHQRLSGLFAPLQFPNPTRMLRWQAHPLQAFRLDLWHETRGVRLERSPDGAYQFFELTAADKCPAPTPEALPSDPRFLRKFSKARREGPPNYFWNQGSPEPGVIAADFAARFSGFLLVPRSGEYTFKILSDEGFRLQLDGRTILADWTAHPRREVEGKFTLAAGWHDVLLEYFNQEDVAVLRWWWSGPGMARDDIPRKMFFAAPADRADWWEYHRPVSTGPGLYEEQGLWAEYYWGPGRTMEFPPPARVQPRGQAVKLERLISQSSAGAGPVPPSDRQGGFAEGPLDMRYHEGKLMLAQGRRVLLEAPLAAPPTAGLLTTQGDYTVFQYLQADPAAVK